MIPEAVVRMWDEDVASRSLGMELVDAGLGRAVVRMPITDAMINGHDVAHGGYVFLLADSAFACACNSHGPVALAAGADITFISPVRRGDVLEAHAQERVKYGRSGIYDVTVYRANDGLDSIGRRQRDILDSIGRRQRDIVAEFRGRSRTVSG